MVAVTDTMRKRSLVRQKYRRMNLPIQLVHNVCCERPIQNDQMAHTISFLWHVEPNLCAGVRSLHCQLGDKPSLSIDSGLQAMGLRPRDVERATEVTRVLPAEGFQSIGTPPCHPRASSWKGSQAASKGSDLSACPDGCGTVLAAVKTWQRGGRESVGQPLAVCDKLYKETEHLPRMPCQLCPKISGNFARNRGDEGRCCTAVDQGSSPDFSRVILVEFWLKV